MERRLALSPLVMVLVVSETAREMVPVLVGHTRQP
jgi:hypothetical protein